MEPPPYSSEPYRDSYGGFDEIRIRHGFIKKTYSIISLQMLLTTAVCSLIIFVADIKHFFYANSWILWVLMAGTFIIMLVLACCEGVARSYPTNLILLAIFTLFESVIVGCISSVYDTETVLIAVVITSVVVVGITIFAFQTKIDFTGMGIYLFVASLVLLVFGIFAIIFASKVLQIVYSAIGALLFSFYLVFDTQLMLGGSSLNRIFFCCVKINYMIFLKANISTRFHRRTTSWQR